MEFKRCSMPKKVPCRLVRAKGAEKMLDEKKRSPVYKLFGR